MALEYFNHLEELEKDELYADDVLYHFKTAIESKIRFLTNYNKLKITNNWY